MATKKTETKHIDEVAKDAEAKIDASLFSAGDTVDFNEGLDSNAYSIPFLGILQGLSPAVQRGGAAYIQGAQAGQILNTVTREVLDEVCVSVVRRSHTLCYWTPRDDGGGFIREEQVNIENLRKFSELTPDDKGRRINSDLLEVTEHRNFWCVILRDDRDPAPALISMTKSQLKVARDWNTLIAEKSAKVRTGTGNSPVLHSGIWLLKTKLRTKGENNWYVWDVGFLALHNSVETVTHVRAAVEFARTQTDVARQLEHIPEPPVGGDAGEM